MLASSELAQLRAAAARRTEATVELARRICEMAAPTGNEWQRAQLVADLWRERDYTPEIDGVGNVYVRRGRHEQRPVLMLLAHTDTVFPQTTPIVVKREGDILRGPGIVISQAFMACVVRVVDRRVDGPALVVAAALRGGERAASSSLCSGVGARYAARGEVVPSHLLGLPPQVRYSALTQCPVAVARGARLRQNGLGLLLERGSSRRVAGSVLPLNPGAQREHVGAGDDVAARRAREVHRGHARVVLGGAVLDPAAQDLVGAAGRVQDRAARVLDVRRDGPSSRSRAAPRPGTAARSSRAARAAGTARSRAADRDAD